MSTQILRPVAAERLRRKQRLAAALRLFASYGFDEGAGGHITARDPEHPDRFWVNPLGRSFGGLRASDLLLVDHAGTVLEGEGKVNPAGYAIHSQVHAARADVMAAAHSHSVYGRAWSTLGRRLDPITQDACAFFRDHEVYDDFGGVVLDLEEARRIARTLDGHKAVILRNHGLLTVGSTVDEAAWWFVSMESCCHIQLLAEAAGAPRLIDDPQARATYEVMGTPAMGRLNFRPLYERIVAAQPDLLD
ncbi:MAG TPA: class II aldolase/adducin family protein [Rugosimonospora sp.]|nr:class II aldolase/adducin family protein [Rugosimonospora sp.]